MGEGKAFLEKNWLALAIVAGLLLVLLFAVFLLSVSLLVSSPGDGASQENGNINPVPVPPQQTLPEQQQNLPPSPEEDGLWSLIEEPFVEQSCLEQAKVFAGANAWAVSSCSCNSSEVLDRKTYDCTVSAFDGPHPVGIDCVKERGTCRIVSEQGTSVLTFQQLKELVE